MMFALRARDQFDDPGGAPRFGIGVAVGKVPSAGEPAWSTDSDLALAATAIAHLAAEGRVLVDATAARLLRGSIRLDLFNIEDQTLDSNGTLGDDQLPISFAVGDLDARRVVQRRDGRPLSPFVGRSREFLLLTSALKDATVGAAGQVVGIVGEAGMGKSRLLEEFRQSVGDSARWVEGHCLPFASARPYLPILDVVYDLTGTSPSDEATIVRNQVSSRTREAGLNEHQTRLILDLLDALDLDRADIDALSPEAISDQTFDALRQLIIATARRGPLVLAIEDVHWSDETSINFLTTLATAAGGVPLLLITTFRPGTRPAWLGLSYATQIALSRLGPADSLLIVQSAGDRDDMPEALGRAILSRADGNPFFLEELALVTTESMGGHEDGVPETVQGVIFARIDRLPEVTRRVLQTASVLGREFPARLLEAVWAGPGAPQPHLELLCREEFLVEATVDGLPGFVFKHALTQDVAYQSLPTTRQRALHEAAGLCLEAFYAGRVDEAYELLAHHWSKTDDSPRAIGYLLRTAEAGARRYAHHEASAALDEARQHAARLPGEDRAGQIAEITLRLVQSLYFIGRMTESARELETIAPAVDGLADRQLVGAFHFWVAHTASHLGEHAQASRAARAALEEARATGDQAAAGRSLYILCREGWWTGTFREGIAHGDAAVPLLSGAGDYWWLGHCHFFIAHSFYSLGDFGSALGAAARGGAIGDAVADPRLRSWAAWAGGLYEAARGNSELGVAGCRDGVELSPDGTNTAWALGALGFARREAGDVDAAIADLIKAIELAEETHHPGILARFQGWLAEAYLRARDLDRAESTAQNAFLLATETGCPWVAGLARRTQGRLVAERGDLPTARRLLTDARARLAALDCRFDLALTHMDLAQVEKRSGRDPEASVSAARSLLSQLDAPTYTERLRALMTEMGISDHDATPTGHLTPRERQVLALIAEGLSNKQIAERLVISQGTVIRHVANIFAKLGVNNRTAAARAAIEIEPVT
jgi:DNA-binding CsgD family transcriptional regulator/tetratricopeptide (TPR) repeat protein